MRSSLDRFGLVLEQHGLLRHAIEVHLQERDSAVDEESSSGKDGDQKPDESKETTDGNANWHRYSAVSNFPKRKASGTA
jgi:hypothetical protein